MAKKTNEYRKKLWLHLGAVIKKIINQTSFSYQDWAKMLGYKHRSSIMSLANGKTDPTAKFFTMLEIAGMDFDSAIQKHYSEMTKDEIHEEFERRFNIGHPDLREFILHIISLPKNEQKNVAQKLKPALQKVVA